MQLFQLRPGAADTALTTTTNSRYQKPPLDALTSQHEQPPSFENSCFNSDHTILQPLSEFKANYQMRPGVSGCFSPSEDNLVQKQANLTHFELGTNPYGRSTENNSQFRQLLKLDPSVKAAGVGSLGVGSIVYKTKESLMPASMTRFDYKLPKSRNFTSPQQRLIQTLAKYPTRIQPSHLFHMDNHEGALASRTKIDFIPPNRITGMHH